MATPRLFGAFFAAIALVIAGCGASAAPAASVGSPPLGTYASGTQSRPVTLTLLDGGQYKQSVESYHITGTWAARQGQLSFTETGGSGACGNAIGTYTWTYDGTDLRLTLVEDGCDARSTDFAFGPWVKQP